MCGEPCGSDSGTVDQTDDTFFPTVRIWGDGEGGGVIIITFFVVVVVVVVVWLSVLLFRGPG